MDVPSISHVKVYQVSRQWRINAFQLLDLSRALAAPICIASTCAWYPLLGIQQFFTQGTLPKSSKNWVNGTFTETNESWREEVFRYACKLDKVMQAIARGNKCYGTQHNSAIIQCHINHDSSRHQKFPPHNIKLHRYMVPTQKFFLTPNIPISIKKEGKIQNDSCNLHHSEISKDWTTAALPQ